MARPADRAHRLAQKRLDELTGRTLAQLLASLRNPVEQVAMDTYNVAATRVVGGAQRRSAQLSFVYVGALMPQQRAPSMRRALAGVVVTRDSPVTRSPVLRLWREVGRGVELALAVQTASAYAATLASNDLQAAQQSGLAEAGSASGQKIVGWRKELADDACEWCQMVGAERIYSSADSVPFHANDECAVAPVFADEGEE
jgi:hypothetical protein